MGVGARGSWEMSLGKEKMIQMSVKTQQYTRVGFAAAVE